MLHGYREDFERAIELLLADPDREAVLDFFIALDFAMVDHQPFSTVPRPALGVAAMEGLSLLQRVIEAPDGATAEDFQSYLWEDEHLGPALVARAEGNVEP